MNLDNLDKYGVFKHFKSLTQIPRESGNEKEVSDFLVDFAKGLNLEVVQDDVLNVIIKKPGTKGYESAKTVILQGHMDMVCTKLENITFDFNKDKIETVIDGDLLRTKGTTLGADNGIAVAMAMAALASTDMNHPPLVALFTVGEETGMDGVLGMNPEHVKGDILINLDSEDEGTVLASCAGGVNSIIKLPVEKREISSNKEAYIITVRGLVGGHSGIEINKNRANAIKLMGRVLLKISSELKADISKITGGEKMNAIAKFSEATLIVDSGKYDDLMTIIAEMQKEIRSEYEISDPSIEIACKKTDMPSGMFDAKTKLGVITLLNLIPNGVNTMSANIEGLVESSNNIGVLATTDNEVVFSCAVRSSIKSLKNEINNRIEIICNLVGGKLELVSDYPQWKYQVNSPIRDLMQKLYLEMYKTELKIDAIHAGLECGFLTEKLGDIDMISMGPNIYEVHTPNENLSISSSIRVYEFLCNVLENIK